MMHFWFASPGLAAETKPVASRRDEALAALERRMDEFLAEKQHVAGCETVEIVRRQRQDIAREKQAARKMNTRNAA